MATKFKRGTRVEYTYACGAVVAGRILGPYCKAMPEWYRVELTDDHGTYRGGCHEQQLRVVDNRG
jgi:hypothetical protein